MSPQELFSLLIVNNIDFNGNIELTDDGVLWSFKLDIPEWEENFDVELELIEALEEDLEYIGALLEVYEENMVDVDVEEIQFEGNAAFADLVIDSIEIEVI